jgi:hypothetical protein
MTSLVQGQLFVVKWPNRNVSLVKAVDKQEIITKLDEFSSSGFFFIFLIFKNYSPFHLMQVQLNLISVLMKHMGILDLQNPSTSEKMKI